MRTIRAELQSGCRREAFQLDRMRSVQMKNGVSTGSGSQKGFAQERQSTGARSRYRTPSDSEGMLRSIYLSISWKLSGCIRSLSLPVLIVSLVGRTFWAKLRRTRLDASSYFRGSNFCQVRVQF